MLFIGPQKRSETEKRALQDRIGLVEAQYNNAESHKKVIYEDRLNRLTGNVCLISVGGTTDTERQEINDKLVDGLNSVKNSMLHGVVPGGGAALLHASKILDFLDLKNEEEKLGVELMKRICRVPLKVLCENSGISGDYVC